MGRKQQAEEEPAEPSRTAGGCVLVLLVTVVVAVTFRLSATVGILALWLVGTVTLWRAARRRMSDSPATPPPRGVAPSGDVYAGERCEVARVVPIAEGVGFILHPVREEEVTSE
jgi:hypothetical protein